VGLSPQIGERVQTFLAQHPELAEYLTSIVVLKNGYYVMNDYYNGAEYSDLQPMGDVQISVLSALVGQLLAEGNLPNIYRPLENLIGKSVLPCDANPSLTVRQTLMMTENGEWEYRPNAIFALNSLIESLSGVPANEYAQGLFSTLRIDDWRWTINSDTCESQLELSAWDLAMFGYMYLRQGIWFSEQVFPATWIQRSTREQSQRNFFYGMGWWNYGNPDFRMYGAQGGCGQMLYIVPQYDMVIVITTSIPDTTDMTLCHTQQTLAQQLISQHIFPSVMLIEPTAVP
jgi:hypothetical protein